jgi:hypothetical protein
MSRPNFFLIGAPKCGTSAMAHYLGEHPGVVFAYPKEPYYWADDFRGIQDRFGIRTLSKYEALFQDATPKTVAAGEGSTIYLASSCAVERILQYQPDAKFIVMLRNPVDMVVSAHLQELSHLNECERDFQTAWTLQESRAAGHQLPRDCYEPKLLQYRDMARLGSQVERLLRTVSRAQVHVIFFEDFQRDLRSVYRGVLRFLQLEDDGRSEFLRINEAKVPRIRWMTKLLNGPGGTAVSRFLKRRLPGPVRNLGDRVKKFLTTQRVVRKPLPSALSERLRREFADEIRLLESCTGRDLSEWLTAPAGNHARSMSGVPEP